MLWPQGVGKTHLATSLAIAGAERGGPVYDDTGGAGASRCDMARGVHGKLGLWGVPPNSRHARRDEPSDFPVDSAIVQELHIVHQALERPPVHAAGLVNAAVWMFASEPRDDFACSVPPASCPVEPLAEVAQTQAGTTGETLTSGRDENRGTSLPTNGTGDPESNPTVRLRCRDEEQSLLTTQYVWH